MTNTPLTGQIALITGAGRGIGAAIAERLSAMGATVILTGRTRAHLDQTARKLPSPSEVIPCDVQDLASIEQAAERVRQTFKHLDILVNNAGVASRGGPLHKMSPVDWDSILNTNLRGVFYCIRAFTPLMLDHGGHIVNIGSLAGKNALPNGAAYAASKWGLNGLTYSVAEELRGSNIRVSVVCPGSVDTELSPHAGKDHSKMLQPQDVAHVVAMLVTQAPQSFASEVLLRPTQKP
jgi:3-oxoacyl-[acyl-carrier protein] reductase